MPWKIVDEGNGKATVVNKHNGKRMSKEPIPQKRAEAQLKAIYANAKRDWKEVSSTPTGIPAHGDGGLFSAQGLGGAPKRKRMAKTANEKVEKIKELITSSLKGEVEPECTVSVFKQADGRYRWVTLSSNAFRDRDGEIVSIKALEKDVERATSEKEYGPIRWWHVPGADIGDCDFNIMVGKMLVESGTFRNNEIGKKFKEHANDLQVSIGFYHPVSEPDNEGVFHNIKRYERSLLPKGAASNLLTAFAVGRSN